MEHAIKMNDLEVKKQRISLYPHWDGNIQFGMII